MTSKKNSLTFVEFIGPYLNDMTVAAYQNASGQIELHGERLSGRRIPNTEVLTVTSEKYSELSGRWQAGLVSARQDVRTTQRALDHLAKTPFEW